MVVGSRSRTATVLLPGLVQPGGHVVGDGWGEMRAGSSWSRCAASAQQRAVRWRRIESHTGWRSLTVAVRRVACAVNLPLLGTRPLPND